LDSYFNFSLPLRQKAAAHTGYGIALATQILYNGYGFVPFFKSFQTTFTIML